MDVKLMRTDWSVGQSVWTATPKEGCKTFWQQTAKRQAGTHQNTRLKENPVQILPQVQSGVNDSLRSYNAGEGNTLLLVR